MTGSRCPIPWSQGVRVLHGVAAGDKWRTLLSTRTGPRKRWPSSLLSPSCTTAVRVLLVGPSLACVGENSGKGSREVPSAAARCRPLSNRL